MADANLVNVFRDGKSLVVPFESPVFPTRCVKTNTDVTACDHQIDLDCSSMKFTQGSGGTAASAVGRAIDGRQGGKLAKSVLGTTEMLVTRKKLSAKIGLSETLKNRFRLLKLSSFGLMAAGPLVGLGIFTIVIQMTPKGGRPNGVALGVGAGLGVLLFIAGIAAFALYSLGLLRATKRTATHVWLDGANSDYLARLGDPRRSVKSKPHWRSTDTFYALTRSCARSIAKCVHCGRPGLAIPFDPVSRAMRGCRNSSWL